MNEPTEGERLTGELGADLAERLRAHAEAEARIDRLMGPADDGQRDPRDGETPGGSDV